jgi:xanthine dehydrogenase YagR molybdenum-binding subunit
MAVYEWPKQGTASIVGKRVPRTDGLEKATGAAKYAYDIVRPGMLFAHLRTAEIGHAKVKSIDITAAEKVPGVVKVKVLKQEGNEIRWTGDPLVCVAAESDAAAAEGCKAVKVEWEKLDVYVNDEDLEAAKKAGRTGTVARNVQLVNKAAEGEEPENAEIAKLLKEAEVVVEGHYGIQVITHCCLETHGSTCEWKDGKLIAHLSTQNVSGTAGQFAGPLKITANEVTVHCDFIGGGFGSKFAADIWGVLAAEISKETNRPVKLMLDRRTEQEIAGNRPSGFINVKVGADKQGVVTVWDSHHWGTSGLAGGAIAQGVVPYVFDPKNRRRTTTPISTNAGPQRAWRAPNHPQGCAITQTAYDDIAAKLGISSYDVFLRNLPSVSNGKAEVYTEQLKIAAELIGWKDKWHAHGKGDKKGSVVTGLGIGIHTWGGGGHNSRALVKVHPDGGVEVSLGSQDLGTGTRTCIGMVAAETFGLPLSAVKVNIGLNSYPESGPSGGSTTIGGVSESTRRATLDALDNILGLAAEKLGVKADTLEAKNGKIQEKGGAGKSLSWKEAAALLGMKSLEVTGEFVRGKTQTKLSSSQVAGVQMAEVAVDLETGVVKMLKFVAVQDMGLIVNRLTAESQIYGSVIMGIASAIFEERIMDPATGRFINAEMSDYNLPRLGDIGQIVVHLYEPASEYNRGIVGLGEPPVIAPGAAIANAVANATGTRVPVLPFTPQRVLKALKKA